MGKQEQAKAQTEQPEKGEESQPPILSCLFASPSYSSSSVSPLAFFCWLRAEVGAWQPNFSQTGDYHGTDFLRGSFDWLLGWVLPPACPIPRHGGIADHLQLPELAFPDARFLASCKISSFQERNRFFPITLVSGWSHFLKKKLARLRPSQRKRMLLL